MKLTLIVSCAMLSATLSQAATNKQPSHGIDPKNMDLKVKPGTDFYNYATGGWRKANPIPAEYSRFGIFNMLNTNNAKRIKGIIEDIAHQNKPEGSIEQKIGLVYNKVLDSKTLNQEGIAPLLRFTQAVDKLNTRESVSLAVLQIARTNLDCFYSFIIDADFKDSKHYLLQINQGGLSMGQRDFYLNTDPATMKVRNAFREYGKKVFAKVYPNASDAELTKKINDVIRIETRLAQASSTNAQMRIPENNYHKMTYATFHEQYPTIDWQTFAHMTSYPTPDYISVNQPEAIKEANHLLATEDLEALKSYMVLRISETAFNYLSDDLRQLNFDFFDKTMTGAEKELPAWQRGVELANNLFGEAVGRIYVSKYFPEAAKTRMEKLVKNLQTALGERIKTQDWMSEDTKQKALEKLSTFYVKIGYPNKWRDYSALRLPSQATLLDLYLMATSFNIDYDINKKIGKAVDRDEWGMTPQTVNAYYNPSTNEICFPAGILQYPFFDMQADDAFNYGAIGVVIGHEMTHGFDDQGRKYDKDGNMHEWWSKDDSKHFDERTQVIIDFFNKIKVLPDLHANGTITQGENLADHGGLQVAYAAYKDATKGKPQKTINGLTPDQRFFVAFANVWACNTREPEIRKRTISDPHSLPEWRVNASLPHIDAWYNAFHITSKDPMFVPKDKRVNIW